MSLGLGRRGNESGRDGMCHLFHMKHIFGGGRREERRREIREKVKGRRKGGKLAKSFSSLIL